MNAIFFILFSRWRPTVVRFCGFAAAADFDKKNSGSKKHSDFYIFQRHNDVDADADANFASTGGKIVSFSARMLHFDLIATATRTTSVYE